MLKCEIKVDLPNSIGLGFDEYVSRDSLVKAYKKSQDNGEPIILSKGNCFDSDVLSKFVSGIISSSKTVKLDTDNIEVLKSVNSLMRATSTKKRILVIDNHNFFHRMFHALPVMTSKSGIETTLMKALSDFLRWLIQTQDRYTHIVFSSEGGLLKRKSYDLYKSTRSETSPSLKNQIKICEDFLERVGFNVLRVDGYEADDVLASIVSYFEGVPVTAYTSDKDAYQLGIYDEFEIMDPKRNVRLSIDILLEKYGVAPEYFLDYQAIVGDTSDSIPGAKGFGDTAAKYLIQEFGTIDNIYDNIDNLWANPEATKVQIKSINNKREKFLNEKDNVYLSKDLATLRTYLLSGVNLNDFAMPFKNYSKIIKQELSQYDIVF